MAYDAISPFYKDSDLFHQPGSNPIKKSKQMPPLRTLDPKEFEAPGREVWDPSQDAVSKYRPRKPEICSLEYLVFQGFVGKWKGLKDDDMSR